MGFFTFLQTGQQDEKNPEGWMVRKKGRDFWEPAESMVSPEDEIRPVDTTPVASGEELKPYTQRRGEATSKVLQTADRLIDTHGKLHPDLAAQAKREVRANPENAAKTVEKFFGAVQKSMNKAQDFPENQTSDLTRYYDNNFADLENSVRTLRVMKRGAEEKSLASGLQQQDVKKNLSELQNLRGQLDTLTKDIASQNLPEAVSMRGEQENSKVLGDKQQKAAALAEHIKQLESVTNQPAPNAPAPQNQATAAGAVMNPDRMGAAYGASTGLGGQTSVIRYMDGLGIPKEALVEKLHTALTNMGIPKEQWDSQNVDPSAGMLRVLSELDKNGAFAQMVSQQLATAKAEDAAEKQTKHPETDPRIAQTERAIQSREMRMRQLYAELRQAPFMQTWPGIILYVLTSLVTQNPAFAAKLIGGVGGLLAGDVNKDAVNSEIRGLQFEIRHLDRRLEHQEQNDIYIKREAARRLQHKEDQAGQRKWELSKMMLQHRLIIERNAKRGNPETFLMKKLSGEFQRSLGMASKYSGEMQNEFADPKVRSAARQNFNTYMTRAAEIDSKIRELGGAALEEEPEE